MSIKRGHIIIEHKKSPRTNIAAKKEKHLLSLNRDFKEKEVSAFIKLTEKSGIQEYVFYFDNALPQNYVRNVIPSKISKVKESYLEKDFHYSSFSFESLLQLKARLL